MLHTCERSIIWNDPPRNWPEFPPPPPLYSTVPVSCPSQFISPKMTSSRYSTEYILNGEQVAHATDEIARIVDVEKIVLKSLVSVWQLHFAETMCSTSTWNLM